MSLYFSVVDDELVKSECYHFPEINVNFSNLKYISYTTYNNKTIITFNVNINSGIILECELYDRDITINCNQGDTSFRLRYQDSEMETFMKYGIELLEDKLLNKLSDEAIIEYYHMAMKRMEKLLVFATEQHENSIRDLKTIDFNAQNKSAN